jgi:Flp pilus assembly secretin CpaC
MVALGWLLGALCPPALGQAPAAPTDLPKGQVTQVLPVGNAKLSEVSEAVPQLLSPAGKFTIIQQGRAIEVTDLPQRIESVKAILAELGRPAPIGPNIRVEVTLQKIGAASDRGISVNGAYRSGNVVRQGSGGTIRVEPIERGMVHVDARDSQSASSSLVKQMIVVASGREASIEVAKEIPFVDYFYNLAIGTGLIQTGAQIRWQQIGSRLRVRPTLVPGNLIQVDVTPEISVLVNGRWDVIAYERLTTSVTVANGSTINLGGFANAGQEFNSYFFGGGSRGEATGGSFTLRAYVDPPSSGHRVAPPASEPAYTPLIRR